MALSASTEARDKARATLKASRMVGLAIEGPPIRRRRAGGSASIAPPSTSALARNFHVSAGLGSRGS